MRFDDRREVVVTEPWNAEMEAAVESGLADRVILNYALGFDERDLHFLQYLPIRELVILDPRINDVGPIYTLAPKLEVLNLATIDPSVTVDLSLLPNLRDLSASWSQVKQTIETSTHLHTLYVESYEPEDLTPLSMLGNLSSITMKERPRLRALDGLGDLILMTELAIFSATWLQDVAELSGRDLLTRLELEACPRLVSLDEIAGCSSLELLNLSDLRDISSATVFERLTALKELDLWGSTRIIDGDLTCIARLPKLRELRMRDRRHYRPSVAAIKSAIASRR